MGCYHSKSGDSLGRQSGPSFVTDPGLPAGLYQNVSNLVRPVHFDSRSYSRRQPSINFRRSHDGARPNGVPNQSFGRAVSVKNDPGTQLQWTQSRSNLESELQAANMHPAPPGETDEQRLHERLGHLHLDMHVMGGDGNCQFRAISNNLYGSEQHHRVVRDKIVRHMYQHKVDFASFLGEDWNEYMTDMAQDGAWGDELTLRACCDAYGVMVNVISSDEQHWFIRYKPKKGNFRIYKGSPREIWLTYIAPVHYNSIRRRTSQQPMETGVAGSQPSQWAPSPIPETVQEVSEASSPHDTSSTRISPFAAVQQPMQPQPGMQLSMMQQAGPAPQPAPQLI